MTQVNIRLDDDLKIRAEALFAELGLNMTTAITLFIRQSLLRGGIPFEIVTRYAAPEGRRGNYSLQDSALQEKSVFGVFKKYANPALIEHEKDAWAAATGEKHGNRGC
ncbi:MAG: type II toxin-antitoxin system RelB/DinJ family antitoxin [Betaproteobacteria bacterium]|nr:type II toxin-antitoxin system RelB/DinJ family antitoxin [Betaproteobacteria bacterium]